MKDKFSKIYNKVCYNWDTPSESMLAFLEQRKVGKFAESFLESKALCGSFSYYCITVNLEFTYGSRSKLKGEIIGHVLNRRLSLEEQLKVVSEDPYLFFCIKKPKKELIDYMIFLENFCD